MKKILLFLTAISAFLYACKDDTAVTPKSPDKQILTFKINNVTEESNTVDQTSRNIRIIVAAKTDRKSLTPTITLSPKATVIPATSIAQDFTNPVKYTVTAEDGTTQIYSVVVDVKMSSEKVISEFKFSGLKPEVKATIAGTNIDATVPSGTDLKTLVPTIMLSAGSTVSPESGKAQDFTVSPVKYTVTAEDGTKQDYLVKITVAKSTEKQITEFRFAGLNPDVVGTIDQTANTISATVPAGTNLKTLIPTIKLSALATITPTSGTAQDFTNTVNYMVKAEDGSTQIYKVTVKVAAVIAYKNTVFFASGNILYALNLNDGSQKWTFKIDLLSAPFPPSPTISNGVIFIGDIYGKLHAIDASTGIEKWQYSSTTLGSINSTAMVVDGVVYVATNSSSNGGDVLAIDEIKGTKKWSFRNSGIDGGFVSSPTISNGLLFIGCNDGNLYALNALTGEKKWNFGEAIFNEKSSPAVANGLVYFTGGKNLYGIEASTGIKKVDFLSKTITAGSSPTIKSGVVYFGDVSGNFYAVDAITGIKKWDSAAAGTNIVISSSPIVSGDLVYFGNESIGSAFHALNLSNGSEKWKFSTEGPIFYSSPTIANGIVYVGIQKSIFYAIDALTGVEKWRFAARNSYSDISSPLVVDASGNVFYSGIHGNQN
jgi:outer membrane protein assembly factor BamB